MWWPNKVGYVRASDTHDHHDTRLMVGHETHSMLCISIHGHVSEEAYERT